MGSEFSNRQGDATGTKRPSILQNLGTFIHRLPASDKAFLAFLTLVFVGTCFVGLVALERTFLVAVPAHGGVLTEGEVGNPRFVNPLLALTDADRDMTTLTYAGLMGIGTDGLRPVLAESYTVSPDGKVYTFILRKDVKFSDGTPLTAEDVVFTVGKAQDPALKSPELANWANIRAEAVDVRTVRFTLPKAYAPFLGDTTLGILPAHLWKNVSDEQFPFSKLMTEPVGAGPFVVSGVKRDKNDLITEYDLRASSRYALGKPYLDGMRFMFFASSDDVLQAYQRGAIESAYGIPVQGAHTAPYSRVFAVFLNPDRNKAFAQLAVRKALSLAVDRSHIAKDILGGYATPLMGPMPPGGSVTEPDIPSGDILTAAKKVLTDGGWVPDTTNGGWKNAKLKLTLNSLTITTSNVPELKTLATSIQKDWEALGVPTSLEYQDPSALSVNVIRPRAYDALFFGMVVGRDQDLFAFWDSSQRADPGLNIALYANRSVDQLLEKARQESDPQVRATEQQKISDTIASDYGAVFTHAPAFVYATPADLGGVALPQITTPADRFATVSSWHRRISYVWPVFANTK